MVQENELRIGNILNYHTEEGIMPTTIDWQDLKRISEDLEGFNAVHSGVVLNEQVLLDCGFKKGLKYFSYKDFDIDLNGWFGFNNMVANANIRHLHQLQNLYFALTGQELIYRPTHVDTYQVNDTAEIIPHSDWGGANG